MSWLDDLGLDEGTSETVNEILKTVPVGSSTEKAMKAAAAGAAMGTVFGPIGAGIGAAVAGLMSLAGINIRGKTETFSWDVSNTYTRPLSQQIAKELQTNLSPELYERLSKELPGFVAIYIETSGAWSWGHAQRIANDIRVGTPFDSTPYEIIWQTVWRLLMWITEQSDNAHPDLLKGYYAYYLDKTVGYKLTEYGSALGVTLPESTAPSTPGAPSVSVSAGASSSTMILLIVVVAVALLFWKG